MSTEIAKSFPGLLTQFESEIKRALPMHLTAERMSRIALTAFRLNPKLEQCDPRSVFAAVIQSAQLGLEIGMQGRAFLVPYNKNTKVGNNWVQTVECQFIPGWKGLVDLFNRSKQGIVWTNAVFTGDDFDYGIGSKPFVKHKPKGESDPDKMLFVYACGKLNGVEQEIIEVWPTQRVWKHRDEHNKVKEKHYSFKNQEMYARKVVLLQVLKYLPVSIELATAIDLNTAAEMGSQNISTNDALDGTWTIDMADTKDTDSNEKQDIQKPKPITKTKPKSNQKQQKQQKPSKQTSDKQNGDPKFSHSDIVKMIGIAKTQDDLDMAMDVMNGLTPGEQTDLNNRANDKCKLIGAG